MSTDGQSPNALAGLRESIRNQQAQQEAQRERQESARWESQLREAFTSPFVGKPLALPEDTVFTFGKLHAEPLRALEDWIRIARSHTKGGLMPGRGFFDFLPEILGTFVSQGRRKQFRSHAGRWRCFRGMLNQLDREGKKGACLREYLREFALQILPLTMPKKSDLPVSNLALNAAARLGAEGESKPLLAALNVFLKTGEVSTTTAHKLCDYVRKEKLSAGCLRQLLGNDPRGMKNIALAALRAELEAQRLEHRKRSVPQIQARLALRGMLDVLGDIELVTRADEQWSLLDEPRILEVFAEERRAAAKQRKAKQRKFARKRDSLADSPR